MIRIFEKAPYIASSRLLGERTMFPVYMEKDGKEHWVIDRCSPQMVGAEKKLKNILEQLKENDGSYTMLLGNEPNPIKLVMDIANNHWETNKPVNEMIHKYDHDDIWDFEGRITTGERQQEFLYRIYDKTIKDKIEDTLGKL